MIIAIIPAKATSIRLRGKNRLPLDGTELFLHSVKYAIQERITPIVSTDSKEIIRLCEKEGIAYYREVVDDRNLCNCINQVLTEYDCDYFAVLQPTSPIRQEGLLRSFVEKGTETSIYTANKVKMIGHIGNEFHVAYRDQDCKNFLYQFDGNIIYVNADWYRKERRLFCDESEYYVEGLPYILQIDTPADYEVISKII